jgi:uncharacterized protein (TIGR03118 family)
MKSAFWKLSSCAAAAALLAALPAAGSARAAGYVQTNLVSDGGAGGGGVKIKAKSTDPQLQDAWGFAYLPGGPFWICDNNTNEATIYDGAGDAFTPGTPGMPGGFIIPGGAPTGQVSNVQNGKSSSPFQVPNAPGTSGTAAALFIFDSEAGIISAWQPGDGKNAVSMVDNSATKAVYKGLAIGNTSTGIYLYATDFRHGVVEMYDKDFKLVKKFTDKTLPAGYAPFGISNIDGQLFVTFAKQNAQKHDDVPGPGFGYVDVFNTDGMLVQHFAANGALNAPWGVARAPVGFGDATGAILIGNFGDGWINTFATDGSQIGSLMSTKGYPVVIPGLWQISFANDEWGGALLADPTSLYFTAGPGGELDGQFGKLTPAR